LSLVAQSPPADSLRAVLRQVFAQPEFRWQETPNPFRWARETLGRVVDWLAALYHSHPGAYFVVMAVLLTVLVALLVHLGYVVWRAVGGPASARTGAHAVPPPRDAAWYQERARRLVAEGRYAEAIGHRYLALVLVLAQRRAVTFHPSKTPVEYAMEARLEPAARESLQALTGRLYAHLFGGEPCDDAAWSSFDRGAAEVAAHGAPA
jgi:hypothetical protein